MIDSAVCPWLDWVRGEGGNAGEEQVRTLSIYTRADTHIHTHTHRQTYGHESLFPVRLPCFSDPFLTMHDFKSPHNFSQPPHTETPSSLARPAYDSNPSALSSCAPPRWPWPWTCPSPTYLQACVPVDWLVGWPRKTKGKGRTCLMDNRLPLPARLPAPSTQRRAYS